MNSVSETLAAPALPLAGLHAVVTGGGTGIGASVASLLMLRGARVTVMGRREEPLVAICERLGDNAQWQTVDVTQPASVEQAFADAVATLGTVDLLVNNAGQVETAPFTRLSLDLWQRMLDVNLTGTMLCTQQVLPGMLAAGFGRIVNIASTASLKGYAYVAAYCAAKHGVLGLTRALALEVATRGVTVNAVCPGYTETDIVARALQTIGERTGRDERAAREALVQANPQGRLVEPREVADAVAWLAGRDAGAITGQAIAVCGGEWM